MAIALPMPRLAPVTKAFFRDITCSYVSNGCRLGQGQYFSTSIGERRKIPSRLGGLIAGNDGVRANYVRAVFNFRSHLRTLDIARRANDPDRSVGNVFQTLA